MKDQLKHLEELQRFDARMQEFETALKTLPEKLQSLKNDLGKVEALLSKERMDLAETERFRRELEGELKAHEANVAKTKTKLSQVKTGKDYMAAQREVEATRKIIGDREEEILKLIEAIEAQKKKIDLHEKDVAELRAHVTREEDATGVKVGEVQARIAGEKSGRDEIVAKVRPDIMKKYGAIRMRRGLAVVPAVSGVCQGCHMAIPPQLYNTLQRGKTIETCPACARIIYWDEIMKEQKLEQGEK